MKSNARRHFHTQALNPILPVQSNTFEMPDSSMRGFPAEFLLRGVTTEIRADKQRGSQTSFWNEIGLGFAR